MTKARRAGSIWRTFVGRHRGRATALLAALPLLMLSVMAGNGLAGTTTLHSGSRINSHAADTAGTEGKAQLPGRGALAMVDPLRVKPKFSGDGMIGPLGLVPATGVRRPSPLPGIEPRRAQHAAPAHWRAAASPRAPPAQVA